jgi:hypothetical protein
MQSERTNPRANPNPGSVTRRLRVQWGRPLAVLTAIVFVISSAFPAVAGLSKHTESFPRWWGVADVGIALVLGILACAVLTLAQGGVTRQAEDASYRAYRVLIHGILVVCMVFMFAGDRIIWVNCITGFAWRTWLLLYSLPAWLTLFSTVSGSRPADRW